MLHNGGGSKHVNKFLVVFLLITISICFTFNRSYASEVAYTGMSDSDAKETIKLLKASIAATPDDAKLYMKIGNLYTQVKEYELGRRHLEKARELGADKGLTSYGIGYALSRLGYYDEAVVQLKDSLTNDSVKAKAHFEIGYCYYKTRKYDNANEHLDLALDTDNSLADKVRLYKGIILYEQESYEDALIHLRESFNSADDSITRASSRNFINAIKKQQRLEREFMLLASASFLYDDNVTTSSGSGSASDKDDNGLVGYVRGVYYPVKSKEQILLMSYMFYQKAYSDLNTYDLQDHNLLLIYTSLLSDFGTVTLKYDYDYYSLNGDRYFQRNKFAPTLKINETPKAYFEVTALAENKEYFTSTELSGNDFGGGIGQVFLVGSGTKLSLRYNYNTEETRSKDYEYTGNEFRVGLSDYSLIYGVTLDADVGFYQKDYENLHTTFAKKREDDVTTGYFRLKRELSSSITAALRYDYTDNDSNIPFYDYDRNVAYIELRYIY